MTALEARANRDDELLDTLAVAVIVAANQGRPLRIQVQAETRLRLRMARDRYGMNAVAVGPDIETIMGLPLVVVPEGTVEAVVSAAPPGSAFCEIFTSMILSPISGGLVEGVTAG